MFQLAVWVVGRRTDQRRTGPRQFQLLVKECIARRIKVGFPAAGPIERIVIRPVGLDGTHNSPVTLDGGVNQLLVSAGTVAPRWRN